MDTTNFVNKVNTLDNHSNSLYNEFAELIEGIDDYMSNEQISFEDYSDVSKDMDAAFGALNRAILKLKLRATVADSGYSPAAVG